MTTQTVRRWGTRVSVPGTPEWRSAVEEVGFGYTVEDDGSLTIPFSSERGAEIAVGLLRQAYLRGVSGS